MKSSKAMYNIVHDHAVLHTPRRYEGYLGYAVDMKVVYRLFFDNGFSRKRDTKDNYIGEWIDYGLAMKDSTGKVLWIIDEKMKPFLIQEKRSHSDCRELEVLA